jgi:hypothetical protein
MKITFAKPGDKGQFVKPMNLTRSMLVLFHSLLLLDPFRHPPDIKKLATVVALQKDEQTCNHTMSFMQ